MCELSNGCYFFWTIIFSLPVFKKKQPFSSNCCISFKQGDLNICQITKAFSHLSIFLTVLCASLLRCCSSPWPNCGCREVDYHHFYQTLLQPIILSLFHLRWVDLPSRIETLCYILPQCSIIVFWYIMFHACRCRRWWWHSNGKAWLFFGRSTAVRSGCRG